MLDGSSIRAISPIGSHIRYTSLATAQTLTPPSNADAVLIQAITQNIIFTLDGTVATANNGFILYKSSDPLIITIPQNRTISIIQQTASAEARLIWCKL